MSAGETSKPLGKQTTGKSAVPLKEDIFSKLFCFLFFLNYHVKDANLSEHTC